MSEALKGKRCDWCGRIFLPKPGPGRPRRFCKQGCRQSHYISNKIALSHGLDAEHAIVSRQAFDDFLDRRYQLELALADVNRAIDAAEPGDPIDHERWMLWLREHVEGLLAVTIEQGSGAVDPGKIESVPPAT